MNQNPFCNFRNPGDFSLGFLGFVIILLSLASTNLVAKNSAPAVGSRSYDLGDKKLSPARIVMPSALINSDRMMRDPLKGPSKSLGPRIKPKVARPIKHHAAKLSFRRLEISGEVHLPRVEFESEELDVPFTEPEVAANFFSKTLEDASKEALIRMPSDP